MSNDTISPSQSRILQVARTLLEQGIRPSHGQVKAALNDGTSNSTITAALNLFWERLGKELVEARSHPDIPDRMLEMTKEMWGTALMSAESAVDEKMAEVRAIESEANQKIRTIREELNQAQLEADSLRQELEISQATHELLEAQIKQEKDATAQLQERMRNLQDKSDGRIDSLLAQVTQAQNERRDESIQLRTWANQLQEKHAAQMQALMVENHALKQALLDAERERAKFESQAHGGEESD